MEPLTIEELKALPVGYWVWLIDKNYEEPGYYVSVLDNAISWLETDSVNGVESFRWEDYGTKWIAYKNKEQAEAKGEIVELPCEARYGQHLSVTVYMSEDKEVCISNPYGKRYSPNAVLRN